MKSLSKGKKIGLGIAGVLVAMALVSPSQQNSMTTSDTQPATDQQTEIMLTEQKSQDTVVIKTETKTESIPFGTMTQDDVTLPAGSKQIAVVGVEGERTITYEVTYTNGQESDRQVISNKVTKKPIAQVTKRGTKSVTAMTSSCDPNYSPCVPKVSYDLDCADIGFQVTILGSDPHRLDGYDNDGLGCESY